MEHPQSLHAEGRGARGIEVSVQLDEAFGGARNHWAIFRIGHYKKGFYVGIVKPGIWESAFLCHLAEYRDVGGLKGSDGHARSTVTA